MLEAVKQHIERGFYPSDMLHNPNYPEGPYDCIIGNWKLWALTESVRRTHLIINTVVNTYRCMSQDWVECTGAVMLTARRGLWQAETAMQWKELSHSKSPLLLPVLNPGPICAKYAASDIDDVVQLLWKYTIDPDKIQCWIDRN